MAASRLDDLMRDFRHAFRSLRRTPGFALVAVLTLGLGLGANAAIFGVLDAALLRPLPYPEAERVVTLHLTTREMGDPATDLMSWSYPKFELFRTTASSYSAVAGFGVLSLNLQSADGPERLEAELVSAPYFEVLGLIPAAGRLFRSGDDNLPGQPAEVVLSHAFWRRRFGGDRAVVGRQLSLSGQPLTVIGVAPAGFAGLTGTAEAFVPITLGTVFEYAGILREAGNHWFEVVGRLKPGVSLAAARAEAERAGAVVDRQYRFPEQTGTWSATARQLAASRVDPGFRRSVLFLAGAVGVVLLIACVNLTSLLMVRAVARRRELAVRLALGASRGRLVRQVLTEALALSLAGWLVGVAVAKGGVELLLALAPGGGRGRGGVRFLFDPASVAVDARVVGFALGLAILAALVVGLVPALQASRRGVTDELKAATGGTSKGHVTLRRPGLHQVLVVSEVALALMLLVGAGLLLRSFARLQSVRTGFDPGHLLTFRYSAAEGDRAGRDPAGFKRDLVARLETIPGVTAASVANCAPLSGPCSVSVVAQVDQRRFRIGNGSVQIGLQTVTPSHFEALGITLLRGRGFDQGDRQGSPRVVLINETAARRLWPGQDPLGHTLSAASGFFRGGDSAATVIGVVRDVRYGPLEAEPMADLYISAGQATFGGSGVVFVRTEGDPVRVAGAARREFAAVDPTLPIYNLLTMEERAGNALARPRFATTLLGSFAAMALVLAVIGLYGVMAFAVAQRTREIGLRMALGANAALVLRGVLGQGLALAGTGIGLGLLGALALQRVMAGMLYGVGSSDPATLVAVSLLMALAATAAALIPARRATRVDPMEALRAE